VSLQVMNTIFVSNTGAWVSGAKRQG
jgi:hypothetical protein